MSTFKERLAGHLNDQNGRYNPRPPILTEGDINDLDVRWHEGEKDTDDYGEYVIRLPELVIEVGTDRGWYRADPTWFLTEAMRAILRSDQ